MAIVVCDVCGKTIRTMQPYKAAIKIKGLCEEHFEAFIEETRKITKKVDLLGTALVSRKPRKEKSWRTK